MALPSIGNNAGELVSNFDAFFRGYEICLKTTKKQVGMYFKQESIPLIDRWRHYRMLLRDYSHLFNVGFSHNFPEDIRDTLDHYMDTLWASFSKTMYIPCEEFIKEVRCIEEAEQHLSTGKEDSDVQNEVYVAERLIRYFMANSIGKFIYET